MIDYDTLNVWNGQRLVGCLTRDSFGWISFRYDAGWLSCGGFAISRTLPLCPDEFRGEDGTAHRFFANLLPEGGFREHISRDLKTSDTDFNLLRAIGSECAGALSLLPPERQPSEERNYHAISDEELAELVFQRGQMYLWARQRNCRFSLAGAQDKFPVLVREGKYLLPQGESPSSHILKFEIPGYRNVPAYETFSTMLAEAAGLPVVKIRMRSIDKNRYTIMERYDRFRNGDGELTRAHQEDFCQALGYSHGQKYEEDGGPSFAQCYELLRDVSSAPDTDLTNLLRWQIFNVLAGNSDGHAKNLSLLYAKNGEIRLAPFYDLLCTRAIDRIDHHKETGFWKTVHALTILFLFSCGVALLYFLSRNRSLTGQKLSKIREMKTTLESSLKDIDDYKEEFNEMQGLFDFLKKAEKEYEDINKRLSDLLNKTEKDVDKLIKAKEEFEEEKSKYRSQ